MEIEWKSVWNLFFPNEKNRKDKPIQGTHDGFQGTMTEIKDTEFTGYRVGVWPLRPNQHEINTDAAGAGAASAAASAAAFVFTNVFKVVATVAAAQAAAEAAAEAAPAPAASVFISFQFCFSFCFNFK